MQTRTYKDFPENIKNLVWEIYPNKKQIVVNGFKHFSLKELKEINLNTRLSFPYEIFVAINKA
jgi:hypothetical protein